MWRVLLYLALFGIAAAGAVWLADNPETIAVTWAGREYSTSLAVGVVAIVAFAMLLSLLWALVAWVLSAPRRIGRGSRQRRRERGLTALSRGIVAVGAGDVTAARRFAGEAERLMGNEPLALLLKAQAAQASGNREAAESAFRRMSEIPETRVLGLRGLFVEARRRGDTVAARGFAENAARLAPAVSWANEAVLEGLCAEGDWSGAVRLVERRASLGLVDRATSRRQRAVLHTADALTKEAREPDAALTAANDAVRLAPDLVPAAALAGRLLARRGDLRRAAKVIETAWQKVQHPDLAAAYLNLRTGDSAMDRLRRAETLARLSSWAPESRLAIARAALEARQMDRARDALRPLTEERPSVRVCLAMAEIEGAEDAAGRVREWLARAARAPRDKAWIADGLVSDSWAPISPVSGRLDAFVWDTPPEVLGATAEPERLSFGGDELEEPNPDLALPLLPAEPKPVESGPTAIPQDLAKGAEPAMRASDTPARPEPEAAPTQPDPVREPASPEPATVETLRRGRPNGSGSPVREPAPVVFPVTHSPDDPGAEEAEAPRPRLRFRG